MAEPTTTGVDTKAEVSALLHTVSELLREGPSLGAEEQCLLAELVDELSKLVAGTSVPSTEVTHLTRCVADLVRAAHESEHKGLIVSARDRLEKAWIAAEAEAPTAAGFARRLVESLSNLGI
jgi:hypothetical protein